jgi:alkanesulfonate monooxygenase SsuD/methylene tetrahydromethanopterin reductase-like flavin-dependent oxidoreductase (luciferase family)
MKLRIFTEPQQGASYAQLLAVAQRAEQLGFDAFFRSDHFLKMGDVNVRQAHRMHGQHSQEFHERHRKFVLALW